MWCTAGYFLPHRAYILVQCVVRVTMVSGRPSRMVLFGSRRDFSTRHRFYAACSRDLQPPALQRTCCGRGSQ